MIRRTLNPAYVDGNPTFVKGDFFFDTETEEIIPIYEEKCHCYEKCGKEIYISEYNDNPYGRIWDGRSYFNHLISYKGVITPKDAINWFTIPADKITTEITKILTREGKRVESYYIHFRNSGIKGVFRNLPQGGNFFHFETKFVDDKKIITMRLNTLAEIEARCAFIKSQIGEIASDYVEEKKTIWRLVPEVGDFSDITVKDYMISINTFNHEMKDIIKAINKLDENFKINFEIFNQWMEDINTVLYLNYNIVVILKNQSLFNKFCM